ncbi:unnamed protein product [Peronospora destructor]|nr:unnamed protein product [Peronospora destructor]
MEPSELGLFGNVLAQHGTVLELESEQFALLSRIAAKRVEWLKGEIEELDKLSKTFSWEMPYAGYYEYKEIAEFLRGPQQTMILRGERSSENFSCEARLELCKGKKRERIENFSSLRKAKKFAATCSRNRSPEPSYIAKAIEGDGAFVTITKTRQWFKDTQTNFARYKEELANLSDVSCNVSIA